MIVIFLIGLIGSVIGYNMKGSIDEGRHFRTEQAAAQVRDLLLLEVAKGTAIQSVVDNPLYYLRRAGITKDPKKLIKDGWDIPFKITVDQDDIVVTSEKDDLYIVKKGKKAPKPTPSIDSENEE